MLSRLPRTSRRREISCQQTEKSCCTLSVRCYNTFDLANMAWRTPDLYKEEP